MHITSLEFSQRERISSDANIIETYGGYSTQKATQENVSIHLLLCRPRVRETRLSNLSLNGNIFRQSIHSRS